MPYWSDFKKYKNIIALVCSYIWFRTLYFSVANVVLLDWMKYLRLKLYWYLFGMVVSVFEAIQNRSKLRGRHHLQVHDYNPGGNWMPSTQTWLVTWAVVTDVTNFECFFVIMSDIRVETRQHIHIKIFTNLLCQLY